MARSVVGPFAMEAPLGLDPRRAVVFRAVHMQQKKTAAVRLFSTPMGMTPESKRDFAQQIEDLKELRHPGIVRCYGGGFDKKDAYLAYEFIDGESLDVLLVRRDRLPWETALDYALQIAEALQYAHERRWLHNRLRADKILICNGGLEVRVTDFRRDDDTLWMNPTQISPTQRAYLAPECQGDPPFPNERSDVYSLGVLLYLMLTGRLPFETQSAEHLMASIQQSVPTNVSAITLDCPVWLSTLVAQMLEKEPLKRPYSMAAVVMALNQARSRAAGGVSVAEHVASGFNPLQLKGDRTEAEKVLGRKKKKKQATFDNPLLGIIGGTTLLIVCLLVLIVGVIWVSQPLNEETLRQRAQDMMLGTDLSTMNTAKEQYLLPLIERFPNSPNAEWAKEQIDTIETLNLERRINNAIRFRRDMETESEQKLAEAIKTEKLGDSEAALKQYQAIMTLMDNDPESKYAVLLAKLRIERLEEQAANPDDLETKLNDKLSEAETAVKDNKPNDARKIWESIIRLYGDNTSLKTVVDKAKQRLEEIGPAEESPKEKSETNDIGN